MRKELKKLNGQRDLFSAKVVKQGSKSSFKGSLLQTVLLKEIRRVSDGKLMCDHLWLNKTKAFDALNLSVGSEVQFAARVKPYTKGYKGKKEDVKRDVRKDFKLSHPTQVKLVERQARKDREGETKFILRKKSEKL